MARRFLFPIFYSTFFTLLYIVLIGLLLVTPADAISQALSHNQLYNVLVIAGGYLLTLILGIILYASRLYTNRTIIAGIPKTWIPIEKGDVRNSVRKMIMESLSRNAVIAWSARPRVLDHAARAGGDGQAQGATVGPLQTTGATVNHHKLLHRNRASTEKDVRVTSIPLHPPAWGEIAHEGWSSPLSPDLPNLQFITVILELPHLIEAKAVSLAPPDAASTANPAMPDLRAVELLQRPACMGLRSYINYLTTLGIISTSSNPVLTDFLTAYENARFSSQPCTEKEFCDLMKLFADILRSMIPLDPAILDSPPEEESDIDADASSTTTTASESPRSRSRSRDHSHASSSPSYTGSQGTIRNATSRRRYRPTMTRSLNLGSSPTPTAPSKKRDPDWVPGVGRSISLHSFAQTKRPYPISQASSSSSLRAAASSGESVIKLSKSLDPGDLPYRIQLDSYT